MEITVFNYIKKPTRSRVGFFLDASNRVRGTAKILWNFTKGKNAVFY